MPDRGRRNLAAGGILVLVIATVIGALALSQSGLQGSSASAPAGPTSFTLRGLGNKELVATELRGKPAVLAFVQAGCGSCATTLDQLAGASRPGVRTLAVGFPSTAEQLASFGNALGVAPRIEYMADPDGAAARALGVNVIDTVVVLNARGRVIWSGLEPSQAEIAQHTSNAEKRL